jgi:4-hydroxybenzoyl-CoA thioesterase/acyl-CoA thioester hydrolase
LSGLLIHCEQAFFVRSLGASRESGGNSTQCTMGQTFSARKRVEFRDTDAAGIVHFSVFFSYMEQTEHEFLRSLGISVIHRFDDQIISWPRVRAECNYRKPARFEDELTVEMTVARIGAKSVTYAFRFLLGNESIADGQIVAACCEVADRQLKHSVPVPEGFAKLLQPFLAASKPA